MLAVAGFARTAAAQLTGTGGTIGTTTPGTTALTSADLQIVVQAPKGESLLDFDLQRFFNIKNCECSTPVFPFFTFTPSGLAKLSTIPEGTIQFEVGYGCDALLSQTVTNTTGNCQVLGTEQLTTFANNGGFTVTTDARALSTNYGQPLVTTVVDGGILTPVAVPAGGDVCAINAEFTQTLWAFISFQGSTALGFDVDVQEQLDIDLAPPPAPTNLVVQPGNEGLNVSWTAIDTIGTPDFLAYQLLCDRGGALQVFKNGTFTPQFQTCPSTTPITGVDGNVLALDPNYTCSDQLTDATAHRIKVLQNGVTYGVAVVAIDQHGNASPPMIDYGVPIKTLSFFDVYRNGDSMIQPGGASGGFCAVRAGPIKMTGLASVASLVGLGVGLVLIGRRRRRRRGP